MKGEGPLTTLTREAFLTASYASPEVLGIALLGRWAEKVVGYLEGFPVEISAHTLSVLVLVCVTNHGLLIRALIHDFQFITHYLYKN